MEREELSIIITGCEHNTWQGEFTCGGYTVPFLSELDLLRLIDDQLNKYRREDEKERLLWGYLKKNMKGR